VLASLATDDKGTFQLTPNGHFHHWPWGPCSRTQAKQGFVGKQTRDLMHVACNDTGWYVAAPNRPSFHTLVIGASFPTAKLVAITKLGYPISGVRSLAGWLAKTAAFLRDPNHCSLLARPNDGKCRRSVIGADNYNATADRAVLPRREVIAPAALATAMTNRGAGYVTQPYLAQHPKLIRLLGPGLRSMRVIVRMAPKCPLIRRAVSKSLRVAQGTGGKMAIDGPPRHRPSDYRHADP